MGGALLSWAIYVLIGDAHGLKAVGSDEKAMLLYRSILILVLVSVGLLLAFILQLLDFSSNMWRLQSAAPRPNEGTSQEDFRANASGAFLVSVNKHDVE